MIADDDWSDLQRFRQMPDIDTGRMHRYRIGRIKAEMAKMDVSLCVMVSPISLRYTLNYRNYAAFMSHIPSTYLFVTRADDFLLHAAFEPTIPRQHTANGQPISFFYGGYELQRFADALAQDIVEYLNQTDADNRRVAVEYINPSVTLALTKYDIEVIDGVLITEAARLIKSADEIACIRWAMAVAKHGADKIKQVLQPGVSELQLWALLNYTNLANNGDWHDGRMLASAPRINPWLQEASERKLESGDLLGFDTDMIGPMGYFADLSRTFHCGPAKPTPRQKTLYRLARDEVEFNLGLIKPGAKFSAIQAPAYDLPEEFHANAYPCIIHGVGMCDEYPHIQPKFRGTLAYDGVLEAGMVLCIESYIGAVAERDGVKLEQQVVVTETGYDLISNYPYEADLM